MNQVKAKVEVKKFRFSSTSTLTCLKKETP